MRGFLAVAGVLLLAGVPAAANDSSAELAAGGIRLVPNWDIRMEREDLYLSADEVRVLYRFRNTTDRPIRQIVAFPLPDIDMMDLFDIPVAIPQPDDENFVGFTVRVNGYPIVPQVEKRALSRGIDMTGVLERHAIPLNPFAQATYDALAALGPEARAEFEMKGLGHAYEPYDPLQPFWLLRTVFYWEQVFEADAVTYVEHSYRPVAGSGFFSTWAFDEEDTEDHVERYCMDDAFEAGVRRKLAATGSEYLLERRLSYILRTARNWQGTIGEISIVIEKPSPDWLVSLCIDGIRKIDATRFEFTATDFMPERDLELIFVGPPGG